MDDYWNVLASCAAGDVLYLFLYYVAIQSFSLDIAISKCYELSVILQDQFSVFIYIYRCLHVNGK